MLTRLKKLFSYKTAAVHPGNAKANAKTKKNQGDRASLKSAPFAAKSVTHGLPEPQAPSAKPAHPQPSVVHETQPHSREEGPAPVRRIKHPEQQPILLAIEDLSASIEGKRIVNHLTLRLRKGCIHALMGPNGGGKSTLSNIIMGHPKYLVDHGSVTLEGIDLLSLMVDERARKGVFLGFQYPLEIPGVHLAQFLRTVVNIARKERGEAPLGVMDFQASLLETLAFLKIPESFAERTLNEGFSGGEKKRAEILQMLLIKPVLAILDEPDSGLDIDSLKVVARGIKRAADEGTTILLITHYQRLLSHVRPDFIHVIIDGSIVKEGDARLAHELEAKGYDWLKDAPDPQAASAGHPPGKAA